MATYSNPSELARGLCWDLDLRDPRGIQELGGTVTGALQYQRGRGAYFDGANDYITFPAYAQPFSSGFYGCTIDFTPSTMLNDGLRRYFFHSVGSAACSIIKLNADDSLRLRHNGIDYVVSAYATWSQYLRLNVKNTITATVGTGGTKLYLNGVLLGSSGAVTTSIVTTGLNIGASDTGTEKFLGSISSVKFFRHNSAAELLTAQEASDFYLNRTYNYAKRAACILPMQMSNHEPNHALQVSEVDQTQLCADADMEAATVAAWTTFGAGGTFQKVAGSRPGGTGSRVLQIVRAGAMAYCYQTILSVGTRYRVTGWARGDGLASWPRVGTGAATYWSGTTSASWQYCDCTFVSTNTDFTLYNHTDDGTCEFDDFAVTRAVSILSDGDIESSNLDAWSVGNLATLTKSATLPYSGTYCLQVAFNAVANPYAAQFALTVGKRYRVIGYARGDGVRIPSVQDGAVVLWTGTAANTWQSFSVDFTATTTAIRFYSNAVAAGYCEFDALAVVEYRARTLDASGRGNNFLLGDGTTPTTFPTKLSQRGYYSNETSVRLNRSLGLTDLSVTCALSNILNDATNRHWITLLRDDDGTRSITIGKVVATSATNIVINHNNVGAQLNTGIAITPGILIITLTLVAATMVAQIYVNGKLGYTSTPLLAPNGYNGGLWLGKATSGSGMVGNMHYAAVHPFAMTPLQIQDQYIQTMQSLQAT